jgi:hypothetical protein
VLGLRMCELKKLRSRVRALVRTMKIEDREAEVLESSLDRMPIRLCPAEAVWLLQQIPDSHIPYWPSLPSVLLAKAHPTTPNPEP